MRIALTVDPYLPVPPSHYGGIERVVDFLVNRLRSKGHTVTLFAHPDSRTEAELVPYGVPPHTGFVPRTKELWEVGARLFVHRRQFDIVHSFGRLAALLPVLPLRWLPKIQSYQRGRLPLRGIRRAFRLAGPSLQFTACSSHMYERTSVEGRWTTVFNGVEFEKYSFVSSVPENAPLAFLGRIEPIKGPHHAIEIAKRSRSRLVIAGNIPPAAKDYFEARIAPHIDNESVVYVGAVDDQRKNSLLGGASALLMPIEWEEPFGIVMVEAMACGTPVLALARGSVPEIVSEGINGMVRKDLAGMSEAVGAIPTISRESVRRSAESRFGADIIADAYERLYQQAMLECRKSRSLVVDEQQ